MANVPSDLEISQNAALRPIVPFAKDTLGLEEEDLKIFGRYKSKVRLETLKKLENRPNGKYIDVTCITPTPLGEGKTVTTIGLTQGLGAIGKKSMCCIRQPSMGPTFGIKGGAAGGGYSQVVPMEDFNLHLTGDFHAITAAHNLIAAALDARLYHETKHSPAKLEKLGLTHLGLDPWSVVWRRVLDVNDRALRNLTLGLGGSPNGVPRESGFDITAASEIMAILALADSLADLRERIGRVIVAYAAKGKAITAEDVQAAGAATVLLMDAIHPNLMQTLEGQPAFVHAGPFANIAHGNSSIVSDKLGLKLADYVVTESGFGSDMGMEKFFNIKCRYSGLVPDAVVLVCTVRALKMHGGGPKVVPGRPLKPEYTQENLDLVREGAANLRAHLRIVQRFGVPAVVSINAFPTDTPAELDLVRKLALEAGAAEAVVGNYWARGGEGGRDLAEAVVAACEKPSQFEFLYPLDWPLKRKIEKIVTDIYGGAGVAYTDEASKQIKRYEKQGFGDLPVCMAKTQYSLSHDAALGGTPQGFTAVVREVRLSAGAGFVYPILGDMQTMPGLPTQGAFQNVDLDLETGKIRGLF